MTNDSEPNDSQGVPPNLAMSFWHSTAFSKQTLNFFANFGI
jgi:hypothetical protein